MTSRTFSVPTKLASISQWPSAQKGKVGRKRGEREGEQTEHRGATARFGIQSKRRSHKPVQTINQLKRTVNQPRNSLRGKVKEGDRTPGDGERGAGGQFAKNWYGSQLKTLIRRYNSQPTRKTVNQPQNSPRSKIGKLARPRYRQIIRVWKKGAGSVAAESGAAPRRPQNSKTKGRRDYHWSL